MVVTPEDIINKVGKLSRAEAEMVLMSRELRKRGKPCMLIARWDGLAWQIHEASPPLRVAER
jgi:hypothetical protein